MPSNSLYNVPPAARRGRHGHVMAGPAHRLAVACSALWKLRQRPSSAPVRTSAAVSTAQFYSAEIIVIDTDENRLQVASTLRHQLSQQHGRKCCWKAVMALTQKCRRRRTSRRSGCQPPRVSSRSSRWGAMIANIGVHGKPVTLHMEKSGTATSPRRPVWSRTATIPVAEAAGQRALDAFKKFTRTGYLVDVVKAWRHLRLCRGEHALKVLLKG